jgi:class 3 adenylate cyclase
MDKRKILFRAFDLLVGAACIAWFFFPVAMGPISSGISFVPYTMPLVYHVMAPEVLGGYILFLAYLVPLIGVFKIASPLVKKSLGGFADPMGVVSSLFSIVATAIMLYAFAFPLTRFADSRTYFYTLPTVIIGIAAGAFVLNIAAVTGFIKILNARDAVYREYREFKAMQKTLGKERDQKPVSFLEFLFRIRSKLFFAFIGIISLILVVLSVLLLNNYRTTILKAVGDGARRQVEQASSNYRINLGDSIAMFEYLNRLVDLNKKAEFAYESLVLYSNLKDERFLDEPIEALPDFRVEYSTLQPGSQFPLGDSLPGPVALTYLKGYSATRNVLSIKDAEAGTIRYVSPIIKQDTIRNGDEKIRRERLLGFSVMTFNEDVIMRPYYLTRVTVFVFTSMFIYIAVILTYIVGNYIVNPLLFLRMNVRKISDILTNMIRGNSRISANTLVYNDAVHSRDEIKSLSGEINDMVTVIRGIIPYISASTLKHAEKGEATSGEKELTFLFTDIRGFTTLCEGMKPDEVVAILNRYLDLETEIILNNHGDVDKFVGDEMMAFFEGPDKEINACRAAMQIRQAMMEEREAREKAGHPVVSIGIGINTGPVVFGSVGARDRMDFTSIGDTVNLAARLEGANKAYGSKTIITEAVYERVQQKFLCRELDFIAVKGKTEPVRIYEILQEIPRVIPKLEQIRELFERGLGYYRKRKWASAATAFRKNAELFGDEPSKVFLERIEHFERNPPPPSWDGVFRMTVK